MNRTLVEIACREILKTYDSLGFDGNEHIRVSQEKLFSVFVGGKKEEFSIVVTECEDRISFSFSQLPKGVYRDDKDE